MASSNPLIQKDVLDLVFRFLGSGEGVFVLCVEKRWHTRYSLLPTPEIEPGYGHAHNSNCTSFRAVFGSASRVRMAAELGKKYRHAPHLGGLQYFIGGRPDVETLAAAYDLGFMFTVHDANGAAKSGDLIKLKWLCAQGCPVNCYITSCSAGAGSVEILRWLKDRGHKFDKYVTILAARRANNLPVLQYLVSVGCPLHEHVCHEAAGASDFEQVQWLHNQGAVLDTHTAAGAAKSGAVHILEWLWQQGVTFDATTMAAAARGGHLTTCKWLLEAQCPWNAEVCSAAAGHFDLLRFLHGSGCSWDPDYLVRYGSIEVKQYVADKGCSFSAAALTDALEDAGVSNCLAEAQWLRAHGAEWPSVLCSQDGDEWTEEMIIWARAEGCTSVVFSEAEN